jgi:hypothetical protein
VEFLTEGKVEQMTEIGSNTSRLAQDLNDLLQRLRNSRQPDAAELIEQAIPLEAMGNFKLAVDAMRQLLWIYIEAASRATAGDLNNSTRGPRLQRATEVLRGLREDGVPVRRQLSEGRSFIEQMEALLVYYSSLENSLAQTAGQEKELAQSGV